MGLDVHKDNTTVGIAEGDRTGEVRMFGEVSSDLVTTEKALRQIKGEDGVLHVVYEAGPTGFVLYRHLQRLEFDCIVVTPRRSRSPTAPGKRPIAATPSNSHDCTAPGSSPVSTCPMPWTSHCAT